MLKPGDDVLTNDFAGDYFPQSLDDDASVEESLAFPIPATPAIRQFDEFTIRFPRELLRSHTSARIAIERFVLVPK